MPKLTAAAVLAIAAVLLAGCGSSAHSSSAAAPPGAGAVNPNAPESLPPGDIPDGVTYVPYAVPGAGYTVSAPEGWSRSNLGGAVSFTDKLNTIQIASAPAAAVTPGSVRSTVVPKLAAAAKGFKLRSVSSVTRRAGPAVLTTYLRYSTPNAVTGKFGVLAVERYDFPHRGRDVVLTLSAPDGSDNVDPWRKVTDSLTFTR